MHLFLSHLKYSHPIPRAADRGLILYCVFVIFFLWMLFLVPSSSLIFTNVSVDHRLHLMERVFAAWVIQLGVYHRALEGKGVIEITVEKEDHTPVDLWMLLHIWKSLKKKKSFSCVFVSERLIGTYNKKNVHISHPLRQSPWRLGKVDEWLVD